MTDLYFIASKLVGFFLEPLHVLALLIALATLAAWAGRWGATRGWLSAALVSLLLIGALPIWNYALYSLETRIPTKTPPDQIAGIIVLGGALGSGFITEAHGQVPLNGAAERMTTAVTLMRQYPNAPVVFSGFSGSFVRASLSESDLALRLINEVTGSTDRMLLENLSRNTVENARFSRELIGFAGPGSWLLVTSAFHMPRAIEIFEAEGIAVTPYPTDFRSQLPGDEMRWNLFDGAEQLAILIREWVGLQAYRWLKKPT